MKDKLYEELYPRLNLVLNITVSYSEFHNSWWYEKCMSYKGDKLSDYYDIFFSRFVTFNALYNTLTYTKESFGLLNKKENRKKELIERGDREKAVTITGKHFSNPELEKFFNEFEVLKNIDLLTKIIDSKKFIITHKAGQQLPANDLLILEKLKNKDNRKRIIGVLELLYNVRCNLFHGSKGYEQNQIELLVPLNEIIFHVVNLLYESFTKMTDNLINKIETEIKKLES